MALQAHNIHYSAVMEYSVIYPLKPHLRSALNIKLFERGTSRNDVFTLYDTVHDW